MIQISKKTKYLNLFILGHSYEVKETELDHTGEDGMGMCYAAHGLITLRKDAPREQKISTTLHESIHVLDYKLDIGLTENQVKLLETGLYDFLTRNGVDLNPLLKCISVVKTE